MKSDNFMEMVKDRLFHCEYVLSPKGQEYARNGDRLHNFKDAGKLQGMTPEKALQGMWFKHVISILDIISDIDRGILPSEELINEKFTDVINYPLLLEALIKERIKEVKS